MAHTGQTPHSIWIVIPVYNQAGTVRDVVERALGVHPNVMVVDDGSDNPVEDKLLDTGAHCVRHARNRGKGSALLTGAREAEELGATHIVTMDADGQHMPEEFPKFRDAVQRSPHALIIGRRDMSGGSVPLSSRLGRAFGNFWARLQTGEDVGDVQSGYRAYPIPVVTEIETWCRGFAFEVEIITRAAWAGVPIRHIDVSVRYDDHINECSHFDALRDNLRLALLNTHLTVRSFLPWPHRKLYSADELGTITWRQPLRSLKVLLGHDTTPMGLAVAAGLGIVLGTLPLIGFHTLAILFAAGYLGLNKPMAVASSQLCMPPILPAICIEVGYFLRHGHFLRDFSMQTLGYQAHLRFLDWVLGSVIVAPVFAIVVGAIVLILASIAAKGADGR